MGESRARLGVRASRLRLRRLQINIWRQPDARLYGQADHSVGLPVSPTSARSVPFSHGPGRPIIARTAEDRPGHPSRPRQSPNRCNRLCLASADSQSLHAHSDARPARPSLIRRRHETMKIFLLNYRLEFPTN